MWACLAGGTAGGARPYAAAAAGAPGGQLSKLQPCSLPIELVLRSRPATATMQPIDERDQDKRHTHRNENMFLDVRCPH